MNRIITDCSRGMTRSALMQDGKLIEVIIEHDDDRSLVGNIYKGIIRAVTPGQFAFADFGADRNGFIFLNDEKEKAHKKKLSLNTPVVVQVSRDKTSDKGAYLTTQLSLTGNLLVLMRTGLNTSSVTLSRKIESKGERARIKEAIKSLLPEGYDAIARTSCEDSSEAEIADELKFLVSELEGVWQKAAAAKAPALVYGGETAYLKHWSELGAADEIVVNNEATFNDAREIYPGMVKHHTAAEPIFSRYLVDEQLHKALNHKVWLKSGGFILIDQTEACSVIDVNTGKFASSRGHEAAIFKVNSEAAVEAAAQIRLRNLSGIIIIDFIDMKDEHSKDALLDILAAELKKDRISTTLVGITRLGLVELTRKKTRAPLLFSCTTECEACFGSGRRHIHGGR